MTIWNIPPTAPFDELIKRYEAFFVKEISLSWYVNTCSDWGSNTDYKVKLVKLKDEWVLRARNRNDLGSSADRPVYYLFVADEDARSIIKRWESELTKIQNSAEKIKN